MCARRPARSNALLLHSRAHGLVRRGRYHAACPASAGLGLGRDARALGDVEGREDLRRRRVDADGLIEVCLGRPAAESERKALGDLAWSGVRLGLGLGVRVRARLGSG